MVVSFVAAADVPTETTTTAYPVTTMASAMLFGTVLFCTVAIGVRTTILMGDLRPMQAIFQQQKTKALPLDTQSLTSIFVFLYQMTVLGLILLYAYICENHPPYPHADKSYDRDQFFFLTALLMVVSSFTLKSNVKEDPSSTTVVHEKQQQQQQQQQQQSADGSATGSSRSGLLWSTTATTLNERNGITAVVATVNDATDVLNRDQTEEWKGWMQFMFLLYHYYHAEEVYNAIRIMITCYVWMTGFGNFSFFYIKGDYSIVRVLQMLWRLNFLVICLCLTQGTSYILYYICPLHTYYFLMVYVTMRIGNKHVNYTTWGIRIKLAVLALIIYFIWDVDTGLFQILHSPILGDQPIVGATSGSMWEWYFRSSLDHWSTYLGMIFALNFPITSLFFRKLEAQSPFVHIGTKVAMGAILLAVLWCWVTGPFQLEKHEYNQTNSYFGIVPVLTYIYFRNLTPWLRSHTLDLLHQIGKTTLETYLMQHHIWLTSNAKSLLTLIPGWPKMNFLVVTIIYVYISRRLYSLTLFLRGMILPDNLNGCIRNLLGLSATLSVFMGLSMLLKHLNLLNLISVAFCSIVLGLLLYKVILIRTWSSFVNTSDILPTDKIRNRVSLSGMSSMLGCMVVLSFGLIWHRMAQVGAGPVRPLPSFCNDTVNKGRWMPIDGCNENARGMSYREFGVGSLGTCSAELWGWDSMPSPCRFHQRDAKGLRKLLTHRNVTFVGDSIVRHLYHATCRQLGDVSAGAYNTSLAKWSDMSKTYVTTAVDFRWAPYIANLTSVVDNVIAEQQEHAPDLIVIGGGAWDRLHTYNTVSEQMTLHGAVSELVTKLEHLNRIVPVAWVIPTTINSWALTSDQKRNNIREDQMETFRALYQESGIYDVSSFVLNGTAFTLDRVSESYDGVHYPLSVYDGGAQILANALDWLLPKRENDTREDGSNPPPRPGSMDNPYYGSMMLLFCFVGLAFMDGFMGVSYVAAIFVPQLSPRRLYGESFTALHQRMRLPAVAEQPNHSLLQLSMYITNTHPQRSDDKRSDSEDDEDEAETEGLLRGSEGVSG